MDFVGSRARDPVTREVIEVAFLNLSGTDWRITSPADLDYDCIGWAAGNDAHWWWPGAAMTMVTGYWPSDVPDDESVEAFVKLYEKLGYEPAYDGSLERDFEKVAIYAQGGFARHAARQLPDGRWTSKLGSGHDIIHVAPEDVAGSTYGGPVRYLSRSRRDGS